MVWMYSESGRMRKRETSRCRSGCHRKGLLYNIKPPIVKKIEEAQTEDENKKGLSSQSWRRVLH